MFNDLLESSSDRKGRSKSTIAISLIGHALLLTAIAVAPLIYYQAIPGHELLSFLTPPPPSPPAPPPPPPSQAAEQQPRRHVVRMDQWVAPNEIPDRIPPPADEVVELSDFLRDVRPIGIPEGGGSIPGLDSGERVGGPTIPPPPPPPPPPPMEPIPVGGIVQASRLEHRVEPKYPELARRARVQGVVLLQVTVDERGFVSHVEVLRGHPLLNQAAVDAVSQWRYSPTLLNEEPVPVIATVTVRFVLQ